MPYLKKSYKSSLALLVYYDETPCAGLSIKSRNVFLTEVQDQHSRVKCPLASSECESVKVALGDCFVRTPVPFMRVFAFITYVTILAIMFSVQELKGDRSIQIIKQDLVLCQWVKAAYSPQESLEAPSLLISHTIIQRPNKILLNHYCRL